MKSCFSTFILLFFERLENLREICVRKHIKRRKGESTYRKKAIFPLFFQLIAYHTFAVDSISISQFFS